MESDAEFYARLATLARREAEAAARIEQLEAALREIAGRRDYQLPSAQDIARAALGEDRT